MALTPKQIEQYFASQRGKAKPISPAEFEKQLKGGLTTTAPSSIGAAPTTTSTLPTAAALPQPPKRQGTSSILNFANVLNQAVDMATKKRNAAFLGDVMMPSRGTLAASDFSSILGSLNRASTGFSSGLIKTATDLLRDEMDNKYKEQFRVYEQRIENINNVRDIGLKVAQLGGNSDVVNLILGVGEDVDKAISLAAPHLQQKGKGEIRTAPDGSIVVITPDKSEESGFRTDTLIPAGQTPTEDGIPTFDEFVDEFMQTDKGKELVRQLEEERKQTLIPEERKKLVGEAIKDLYDQTVQQMTPVGEEFTATEKKKLEQAGLLNASRKEQLDFLFKKEETERTP